MKYMYQSENGLQATQASPTFTAQYDVLVVGVGTAGAIAALKAARSGVTVCAMDRLSYAGGMFTSTIFSYYYGVRGGLYEEIDARARELQQSTVLFAPSHGFNRLARIFAMDEAYQAAGVHTMYDTFVEGVYAEGRKLLGVKCVKQGIEADIACKFIVDGTSEAFLCTMVGCSYDIGREFDHRMQPFTFTTLTCQQTGSSLDRCNGNDFGYVDAGDARAVSRMILQNTDNIRLDNAVPLGFSSILGAREGRRIHCEDQVRWEDFLLQKNVEKPVTYAASNMDDHGKDMAFESDAHADWMVGMSMWGSTALLKVPMGALIPTKYDNICIAGRHLYMDHDCSSHLRMMRDMQRIGEVAGDIAYLAVKHTVPAKDIPYNALAASLMATGCYGEMPKVDIIDTKPQDSPVAYPESDQEMLALLDGDKPGLAILYAIRNHKRDRLLQYAHVPSHWLSFNASATLALMNDDSGADVLLQTLRNRDARLLHTSRKFNMTLGITALYLLGRLVLPGCEEDFRNIWLQDQELLQVACESDEFFSHPEDTRFAYLSHAARALMNIADVYPERRTSIQKFLLERTASQYFHVQYTLKGMGSNIPWDATEDMRRYIHWRIEQRPLD